MNGYDYARKIIYMPGMQVEAWINPVSISPRIKKAVQKMVRTGILNGGYRSTSRMLAAQLLNDSEVGISASANKWGVTVFNAILTHDTKAEIINLLEAARMIELADKPASNHHHINSRYQRVMGLELRGDRAMSLSCYVVPINQQIAEVAAASRLPSQIKAANALADQLDDVAPIKVNIHTPI